MKPPVLVAFAVPEEARPFRRPPPPPSVEILVTGMGAAGAGSALRRRLDSSDPTPGLLLTCGFAGGLDARWRRGQVLFDADAEAGLDEALKRAGAAPARFHCAPRVATTAAEKRQLRERTGADAVEMESGVLRRLAREHGIVSATVRVISDAAEDDLPLDFNEVMTPDGRLHPGRLAWRIIRSPGVIAGLVQLRRRTLEAAEGLAAVLRRVLAG